MRCVLLLVISLVACSGLPTDQGVDAWVWEYPYLGAPCDPGPGPSVEMARMDSVPPRGGGHVTVDDRHAEIARQAPGGWGGRFLVNRRMTIYLVRPEEAATALPALNRLGAGVGPQPDILQGRWDFAQMYDWYRYLTARDIWAIDGVYMSDIDERTNRLFYGVTREALPIVAQLLSDLRVPCGLVTASVEPNGFVLTGGS